MKPEKEYQTAALASLKERMSICKSRIAIAECSLSLLQEEHATVFDRLKEIEEDEDARRIATEKGPS